MRCNEHVIMEYCCPLHSQLCQDNAQQHESAAGQSFALSWTGPTCSMKSQGSPHTNWSQSKQRRAVANTQDDRRERGKSLHGFRCRRVQTVPVWSCMYLYVVWWRILMYYVVYGIVWSHVCPLDSCCPNILQYVSYRAVARILTSSPEMQQDPFSWICPPKFYKTMCLYPPWPNSSVMFRRCSSYIWYFVDLFWYFWSFFGVDRDFLKWIETVCSGASHFKILLTFARKFYWSCSRSRCKQEQRQEEEEKQESGLKCQNLLIGCLAASICLYNLIHSDTICIHLDWHWFQDVYSMSACVASHLWGRPASRGWCQCRWGLAGRLFHPGEDRGWDTRSLIRDDMRW